MATVETDGGARGSKRWLCHDRKKIGVNGMADAERGKAGGTAMERAIMTGDKEIDKALAWIERTPEDAKLYNMVLDGFNEHIVSGEEWYHDHNRALRGRLMAETGKAAGCGDWKLFRQLNAALNRSLLIDAKVDFQAYMLYIESARAVDKQFFYPRQKVLGPIAKAMENLANDKLDLLSISLPPGTGKSTLAIFYLTWLAGRNPDKPILTGSHSNAFIKGVYEECLRIMDANGEYRWHDVFPGVKVSSTNAKDCRIDLGTRKRFETLEFTSIGTGNAGLYRAVQLLFCDDLVSGSEVALSKDRLDKLWETYTTDLRQRKMDGCKELHIATRWSVHDVIGRLERQYEGDDRAKFIVIPALNEKDESNFDYMYGVGFTTKAYHDQRDIMDNANWTALFMNQPFEREGQLYNEEELRRFFEVPDRDPDAVVAICDTKNKGSDYEFLPIAKVYGPDWYIVDCICDNGDPGVVEERVAKALVDNGVQVAEFESNSAGWHIAEKIQNRVKALGGFTKITTRYTTANKETKIIVNAPTVKQHCLFLDKSKFKANSDYGRMMTFMTGYTMTGRNKHDDVVDGMAMLALYMERSVQSKVEVIARPW